MQIDPPGVKTQWGIRATKPSSPKPAIFTYAHQQGSQLPIATEEKSTMAQWQRMTVYRYTLPPPYELEIEHLFEELPLSTYPSGTTVEPLAYEMAPGAHLGRATTSHHAMVLFPR